MDTTQKDTKILPVERTQLNWWGNGLEIHLQVTNLDIEVLPHEIEVIGGRTSKVVIQGGRPNCYLCCQRGHIKVDCPDYKTEC